MSELDDLEPICLAIGDPLNNELSAPPRWQRRCDARGLTIAARLARFDTPRYKPSLPKLKCLEST